MPTKHGFYTKYMKKVDENETTSAFNSNSFDLMDILLLQHGFDYIVVVWHKRLG